MPPQLFALIAADKTDLDTEYLAVAVLALPAPADAWNRGFHHFNHFHHFHHFHGHGCCFFGGFGVGVFTGVALGSAFAPVYAYPAPAYVAPPPVYAAPPPAYWYFCRSAGAYYPYVSSCSTGGLPEAFREVRCAPGSLGLTFASQSKS